MAALLVGAVVVCEADEAAEVREAKLNEVLLELEPELELPLALELEAELVVEPVVEAELPEVEADEPEVAEAEELSVEPGKIPVWVPVAPEMTKRGEKLMLLGLVSSIISIT